MHVPPYHNGFKYPDNFFMVSIRFKWFNKHLKYVPISNKIKKNSGKKHLNASLKGRMEEGTREKKNRLESNATDK